MNSSTPSRPDDPKSSSENLGKIRGLYEAFGRGDIPEVLSGMDENIQWREADGFPYAGTYVGPQAVLNGVFMRLGTEWDNYQAVPGEFIDGGDTIVVLGHYSGTYKQTGRAMRAPFAHVYKLRDGKVSEFTQYTDTLLVQRALDSGQK